MPFDNQNLEKMADDWDDEGSIVELVNNAYMLGRGPGRRLMGAPSVGSDGLGSMLALSARPATGTTTRDNPDGLPHIAIIL